MKKYIAVAVDENFGIGKDRTLPWHFHKEMKYFKELTSKTADPHKKNAVLMGRNTWLSLPEKYRPLPGRNNFVVTREKPFEAKGAAVAYALDDAFDLAARDPENENLFICGGAELYKTTIEMVDGIYLTKIKKSFDCDTFFPQIPEKFSKQTLLGTDEEDGVNFEFWFYET